MTNGIVFVLHTPAQAAAAAELADTLTSHVAMPMPLSLDAGVRGPAFGSGATCVLLWDPSLAAQAEAVARIAPAATTVICRSAGAVLPGVFANYTSVVAAASTIETAVALSEAVTRKHILSFEGANGRRATHSPAMRKTPARDVAKTSMLARSAWGLAATVVVASIAAPAIGDRAGAASVRPDQDPAIAPNASTAATTIAYAVEPQVEQELAQPPAPPLAELLEHIDNSAAEINEPAATVSYASLPAPIVQPTIVLTAPIETAVHAKPDVAAIAFVELPKDAALPVDSARKPEVAAGASKPSA